MTKRMTMAIDVRPDRLGFPSAINGCLGGQPGIDAEIVQHPIGLKAQEIRFGHFLGMQKGAVAKFDLGDIEWLHRARSLRDRLRRGGGTGRRNAHRHDAGGDRGLCRGCKDVAPRMAGTVSRFRQCLFLGLCFAGQAVVLQTKMGCPINRVGTQLGMAGRHPADVARSNCGLIARRRTYLLGQLSKMSSSCR